MAMGDKVGRMSTIYIFEVAGKVNHRQHHAAMWDLVHSKLADYCECRSDERDSGN